MKTVSTATLKARLQYYLDAVKLEPVLVQKKEEAIAILLSYEEYQWLASLERNFWLQRSKKAEMSGYIGIAKTAELLKAGLDEKP